MVDLVGSQWNSIKKELLAWHQIIGETVLANTTALLTEPMDTMTPRRYNDAPP
jgi:hypothetical protein